MSCQNDQKSECEQRGSKMNREICGGKMVNGVSENNVYHPGNQENLGEVQ